MLENDVINMYVDQIRLTYFLTGIFYLTSFSINYIFYPFSQIVYDWGYNYMIRWKVPLQFIVLRQYNII